MIASATTLALAIELYLKALSVLTAQPISRDHDLIRLYDRLPGALRQSLEAAYDAAVPRLPDYVGVELVVIVSLTPNELAQEPARRPVDRSFRGTLLKSRDAFVTWRYLHEIAAPGKPARISFDYHCLGFAADVLHRQAVAILNATNQTRWSTSGS